MDEIVPMGIHGSHSVKSVPCYCYDEVWRDEHVHCSTFRKFIQKQGKFFELFSDEWTVAQKIHRQLNIKSRFHS